jgi:obg-like ATPase 1
LAFQIKHLNLINYFTCGKKEVKAWTVRKGCKAPSAAGRIHTDMENGFICAHHYRYKDLKKLGSVSLVKEKGKFTTKGKEYVV